MSAVLVKDAEIEADIEAMGAKLPASLGRKSAAESLSVTLSSDDAPGAAPATVLLKNYGADVTKNVRATGCVVESVVLTNRNAGVRYFQLHNTTTTPAGGDVPWWSVAIPGSSAAPLGPDAFTVRGIAFPLGCAYAWSTDPGTYVAATAADHDTVVMGV